MPTRAGGAPTESLAKGVPTIPANFRAGDWMCPKCNFHNYRSKVVCPQCSTPMPPGGNPPPGYSAPSAASEESKRRKTKWDEDDQKLPKNVPDWLQDLVPKPEPKPKPPPGVLSQNFKVLKMEGVQIRALIGKGGETIRDIRTRSGADIKIDHVPSDLEGTVTIVGEVEKTEQMIKDALATKGCPLGVPRPTPSGIALGGMAALASMRPSLALSDQADANDVQVPAELVGPLIGPGGATIKDIRAKAGGTVYISVLPPAAPGGPQSVRIVGDQRESAKELVRQKIEELKKANQLPRPPAGQLQPQSPAPLAGLPTRPLALGGLAEALSGGLGSSGGGLGGQLDGQLGLPQFGQPRGLVGGPVRPQLGSPPAGQLAGHLGARLGQIAGQLAGQLGGLRPSVAAAPLCGLGSTGPGGLHAKSVGSAPPPGNAAPGGSLQSLTLRGAGGLPPPHMLGPPVIGGLGPSSLATRNASMPGLGGLGGPHGQVGGLGGLATGAAGGPPAAFATGQLESSLQTLRGALGGLFARPDGATSAAASLNALADALQLPRG